MNYRASIPPKKHDIVKEYEVALKILQDHDLEISVNNRFYHDGMFLWHFSAELLAVGKINEKCIGKIEFGIDIPSSITFSDEDGEYYDQLDLCEDIDSDLFNTVSAIMNKDGDIDSSIISELGLEESSSFDSNIAFIYNFSAESPTYMEYLIDVFPIIEEGLSTRFCQLVVCPLSTKTENHTLNYMAKSGWGIRAINSDLVVAYKRI